MSNRDNEFDDFDSDDFFNNDSDDDVSFDFDQDQPTTIGDDVDDDMPLIDEADEDRGGNRTFLIVAVLLILVLVIGLGAVLFIATRPQGPTEIDLTSTSIVEYNMTVIAFGAQTSTQSAEDIAMTQTAAAWTETPTPTFTPSPTVLRPTITPTPTVDETIVSGTLAAILAGTAAALPTEAPPTDTVVAPPVENSIELNVLEAFSTQLAFATAQGAFNQSFYSTQVAIATQFGGAGLDAESEAALSQALNATQSALDAQIDAVLEAIGVVDRALQTAAVNDPFIATQLSALIPIGQATQTALAGQSNFATEVNFSTRQAIATQIANATETAQAGGGTSVEGRLHAILTAPFNAKVMFSPNGSRLAQATATHEPTFAAYQTLVAQGTLSGAASQAQLNTLVASGVDAATPRALATQGAFESMFRFATMGAQFTQTALATQTAQGTDVSMNAQVATQSGVETQAAFGSAVNQATLAAGAGLAPTIDPALNPLLTLVMQATQEALLTPPLFATQAAFATQSSLATRQALINRLLGTLDATPTLATPTADPLQAVNQTATAIAGAFLTATAQAAQILGGSPTATFSPLATAAFPTLVPTALPDTGLFDEIASGGRDGIGVLALAVIGLVGVIVVSRRVRTTVKRDDDETGATPE